VPGVLNVREPIAVEPSLSVMVPALAGVAPLVVDAGGALKQQGVLAEPGTQMLPELLPAGFASKAATASKKLVPDADTAVKMTIPEKAAPLVELVVLELPVPLVPPVPVVVPLLLVPQAESASAARVIKRVRCTVKASSSE
jgi:hypothetical protein